MRLGEGKVTDQEVNRLRLKTSFLTLVLVLYPGGTLKQCERAELSGTHSGVRSTMHGQKWEFDYFCGHCNCIICTNGYHLCLQVYLF